MPQCTLVLVAGRREEQDRGVAAAIQREPSSHCPGVADSPGICPGGGPTGRRMKTGSSPFGRTKNRGTVKINPGLSLCLDEKRGSRHPGPNRSLEAADRGKAKTSWGAHHNL